MSGLFGGKSPSSPPPPVAPTIDNSQVAIQQAQDEQLRRSTAGRASTILTGGAGVTTNSPTSHASLLGLA
jgi:hypothetical protein